MLLPSSRNNDVQYSTSVRRKCNAPPMLASPCLLLTLNASQSAYWSIHPVSKGKVQMLSLNSSVDSAVIILPFHHRHHHPSREPDTPIAFSEYSYYQIVVIKETVTDHRNTARSKCSKKNKRKRKGNNDAKKGEMVVELRKEQKHHHYSAEPEFIMLMHTPPFQSQNQYDQISEDTLMVQPGSTASLRYIQQV